MVEINLLPWREQYKHFQAKTLKRFIATSVILSLLVISAMHEVVISSIETLNGHVAALQDEMLGFAALQRQLEESKRRNEVARQMEQTLLQYQTATEKLVVELVKAPIKHMCFTEISREKNTVIFTGYTRSVEELTEFLTHWDANILFSQIKIESLRKQNEGHFMRFRFQANEKNIGLLEMEKSSKDAI